MQIVSRTGFLWLAMALASCTGRLGGGDSNAGVPGRAGASAGPNATEPPGANQTGAPLTARLQRLTATQYRNVIGDVFGTGVVVPELEKDSRVGGFDQVGAGLVSTSARGVEQYAAAAESVAHQVLSDTQRLPEIVGCSPASPTAPDDACAGQYLDRVGRRLFRRPLDAEERRRYLDVAAAGASASSSFGAGLEAMLTGLLESPLFLYRAEWTDGTKGATTRISGYEMASRLAFALLDSGPDDGLLDAAERGELDSDEALAPHAAALVASERGQQNVANFFSLMLRLPSASTPEAVAMKQETLLVLRELEAVRAPFTDVYTAPFTFVDDALAERYGLPDRPGASLTKVWLPSNGPRRGLLGHAAILNESGAEPSAILRGKYIREALLCQPIPSPPPNVVPVLPPQDASQPQTMRQRLTQHRADAACAACHALMDPLGLALEHFDGVGRYREDDRGMPIDASGEVDGTSFQDAVGLGAALAAHPEASRCLVATLERRLTGQLESGAQDPTLNRLRDQYLASEQTTSELVLSLVGAETFTQTTLPADLDH